MSPPPGAPWQGGPPGTAAQAPEVQLKPIAANVAPLMAHWAEPGGNDPGLVQRRLAAAAPDQEPQGGAAHVHSAARGGVSGPGGPLPHREEIQRSFGRHDVSQIVAHTGPTAEAGARAMGAEAFATGDQVAFAGAPSLHTAAHEAAHVIQQRGGIQLKGGVGQEGDPHERHADQVADQVVRGQPAEGLLDEVAGGAPPASAGAGVQRKLTVGKAGGKAERSWEGDSGCMAFENEFADRFADLGNWAKIRFFIKTGHHNFDDEEQMISSLRHRLGLDPELAASQRRTPQTAAGDTVAGLVSAHKQKQADARQVGVSAGPPVFEDNREEAELHQKALNDHEEDRSALRKIVEQGAAYQADKIVADVQASGQFGRSVKHTPDMDADAQRRLANTCQWVKNGRTKLYALTPTHDRKQRLLQRGMDPNTDQAWFPKGIGGPGDVFGAPVEYRPDDLQDPNVDLQPNGMHVGGWNLAGVVAVANPRKKQREDVWQTLRHEVQHDSDQHFDKEDAVPAGSWRHKLELYKTEYRAYNYERGSGKPWDAMSHQRQISRLGYQWTEKQYAIFAHIFKTYAHTMDGWGADSTEQPLAAGVEKPGPGGQREDATSRQDRQSFQQAVVAYADPDSEGFNKYNSLRVDEFYRALKAIPASTSDVAVNEVQALIRICFTDSKTKLTKSDAQYILTESPDFTAKMRAHLSGAALSKVQDLLASAQ